MPCAWWLMGTALAGEGWTVEPTNIRWSDDGGALSVEVALSGEARATRTEPAWVGVTVVTEAGTEHDLVVHTVFPTDDPEPETMLFSAELAETPKYVLIGAWGQKIEPCDVDRPGCRAFGFVLDESLASFPSRLYTEGTRQRLLPTSYRIGVRGDRDAVERAAAPFADIFGSTVEVKRARGSRPGVGVWVRSSDDLGFAHDVADALGLTAGHDPGLRDPMVVVQD
ncbi:MAG: hypothetical protein AAF211_07760 [Myxococcota bacterium]